MCRVSAEDVEGTGSACTECPELLDWRTRSAAMPITTVCVASPEAGIGIHAAALAVEHMSPVSDTEVEGTDYLLSSTMRLDDAFFQILGESRLKEQIYLNTSVTDF